MELSPKLKTQLLSLQDSFKELVARAVSHNNFHITLSYLGDVTERQLENILDGFEPIAISPFEVSLQDLIYWPKPAIIGLSIKDEKKHLSLCKKQIEKKLSQLNFFSYDKKKYCPHITLFKNVETPLKNNQFFDTKIEVNQVSLIASLTTRHGIQYQTIAQWPLQSSVKDQMLGR